MKKSLFKIIFVLLVVFLCSACNGNVTRDIRHAGFNISGDFSCKEFLPSKKDKTSYMKMKYFLGSIIVDENGKIYEYSSNLKFSSGSNCREASASFKVKAIYSSSIVKGDDNKYYYLNGSGIVPAYSVVPETDSSYYLYDLLLKEEDVVRVEIADNSKGNYYVLKTDGNIYLYQITKADYRSLPTISNMSVAYDKNIYGSIIDFTYLGYNLGTYIKTDDKVYRMRVTNGKECNAYIDVPCTYELEEDPIFVKYHDRILIYSGSVLITDYGKMFTVAS